MDILRNNFSHFSAKLGSLMHLQIVTVHKILTNKYQINQLKFIDERYLHFMVTILHLFLYKGGHLGCRFFIFLKNADYAPVFFNSSGRRYSK